MAAKNLTSRAKLQLGWGDDNPEEYKKWRRRIKAYAISKGIAGRRGTSNETWDTFTEYAQRVGNGLPASGKGLLELRREDKEGNKANERFNYLLLDALKKDRETETREGLAAAARKRKRDEDDTDNDDPDQPPVADATPITTIRVVVVEPDNPADVIDGPLGKYKWATAGRKQLVKLKDRTLKEIYAGIKDRIPDDKHIRAIFGACVKPPVDGNGPDDVERLCTDDDLDGYLRVVRGTYKPPMIQVVLVREGGPDGQSPPPDDRNYFVYDHFGFDDAAHDPVTSDSDNELYLIQFGKKKPKSWPRTDHGFESEKAKTRKRIRRLKVHLDELKARHVRLMGNPSPEIIDSDDEEKYDYVKWLNPQSGRQHLKARTAIAAIMDARAEIEEEDDPPANETEDEYATRLDDAEHAAARRVYGSPSKGDFNGW